MSSLALLLGVGWAFGRCGRDAFFIKEAGPDKLPYMYIINAAFMVLTSVFYSRLVDRITRHRFLIMQLIASGVILLVFRMLMLLQHYTWMPYAIFSLSEVILLILPMQVWTFANDIFDPREGKRIFPLIGGAGLIGTVCGGALTKPVVALISTVDLFVVWAVMLVISILTTLWVRQTAIASGVIGEREGASDETDEAGGFFQSLSDVWRFPLIRTLTYLSIPMWLVVYIVDYQFFKAMDEIFPNQDELTGFLGIFNSVTFSSGFVIQLSITGRLLRRFGVGSTVLSHPISMTFGSIALMIRSFLPTLPSPRLLSFRALSGVFAKFSDNAVFYSIGESASQLLYNALPEEKRGQSRAFISGTIEPVCTALAGGLLIFFGVVMMPIHIISFITVGLSLLWILLTWGVKSDYLRALVENLSSRDPELRGSAMTQLSQMKDATTTQVLLETVASPDDDIAIFALEQLEEIGDGQISQQLYNLLAGVRPPVKIAILSLLSELGTADAIPAIRPLLEGTEPEVRAAAIRTIGKLGGPSDLHDLEGFLADAALDVRTEALIALIRGEAEPDTRRRAVEILEEMADDTDPSVRAKVAYIIGEVRVEQLFTILLELAASEEERLQYESIRAMGKVGDEQVIPPLVKFLDSDRLMPYAIDAIVNLGESVLEPLHRELASDDNDEEIKINIIHCLAQLCRPASIPILVNLLEAQPNPIAEAAIGALANIAEGAKEGKGYFSDAHLETISQFLGRIIQRLQKEHDAIHALQNLENEKGTLLLTDALNRFSQRREETALKCLELLTDPMTIRAAAANLRSSEQRAKAEAIEVLESSCNEARELVRVLEAKYFPEGVEKTAMEPVEIIREVLSEEQPGWLRVCAIYGSGELKVSQLASELLELGNETEPFIRNNVYLALGKIGTSEIPTSDYPDFEEEEVEQMAINMERILFLRSIPLFADVSGNDLRWINEITREKAYSAGETIFKENDEGDALYIIVSGGVRVVKEGDRQVVLAMLQEREYFGEMALLDREPRSASVEVQRDATLLVINRDDFQRLLLARPEIAFSLLKTLSGRLRETEAKLV